MLRLYIRFRRYIIDHPFWPYFLSHGAVHIIGAILTIGLCIHFYKGSFAYEPVYKQLDLQLRDNFFDSASYIEINFDSSADTEAEDTFFLHAVYDQTDTSAMTKLEPPYFDPDRITFVGRDHIHDRPFFASPKYNPYIENSSQTYRVAKLTLETINAEFTCENSYNHEPSVCQIDSVSSNFIQQSTYCDYRKVSFKENSISDCNLYNQLRLKGNFLKDSKDNPYYHFSLIINDRMQDHHKAKGKITFSFSDNDSTDQMTHLNFLQCKPGDYFYNPVDGLTFDIQDVLENGGIYFLAEDMNKKDKAERKTFMSSVLLGACLAFLIDIIINLVMKWRELAKRKKKR